MPQVAPCNIWVSCAGAAVQQQPQQQQPQVVLVVPSTEHWLLEVLGGSCAERIANSRKRQPRKRGGGDGGGSDANGGGLCFEPLVSAYPEATPEQLEQMWRSATVVSAAPNVLIRAARAYARIGSGWKSAAAEPKCAPLPFRAFAQDPVALALQGGLFRCSKQDEDGHGEAGGGGGGGGRGGGKGGRDAEAEVDAEAQGKERRRRDRALQRAGKAEDKDEEPENRGRQIKQKERKKGKDSGREGVAPVKRGAAGAAAAAPAFVPAVHDLSLLEPLSPCLTGMSGLLAADFLVRPDPDHVLEDLREVAQLVNTASRTAAGSGSGAGAGAGAGAAAGLAAGAGRLLVDELALAKHLRGEHERWKQYRQLFSECGEECVRQLSAFYAQDIEVLGVGQ
ncbi:hypothetical protein CHLRE_03g179050v5 [Chlamydomonas reinhardtii]|uniref:Uncharacterized protein n=1 Tax=Chlamydomonas reinhardtii TaxID=3055 RepID=A0A2K3DXM9_CHLRE|nr:uncharacterized protein CHLRE_03g179050v5 [Chlamydomonas reinhardtii]PNW85275.1 hypothetical protein CHLRE_03g179050v5 [Chlamydomonas reinhardtii]